MAQFVPDAALACIAQCLRAHARLCRQVAAASRSGQTAADLDRLADACSRRANELESAAATGELRRLH